MSPWRCIHGDEDVLGLLNYTGDVQVEVSRRRLSLPPANESIMVHLLSVVAVQLKSFKWRSAFLEPGLCPFLRMWLSSAIYLPFEKSILF